MYKRQGWTGEIDTFDAFKNFATYAGYNAKIADNLERGIDCLLYTSDAADERSSVDLGGRRIIKKKTRAHS